MDKPPVWIDGLPEFLQPYTDDPDYAEMVAEQERKHAMREGGVGSGNYGHSGRPGEVGGSGTSSTSGIDVDKLKGKNSLEDLHKFFKIDANTRIVNLADVTSTKDEGSEVRPGRKDPRQNAADFMAQAHDGTNARRKPITVEPDPNNQTKYLVVDGNATTQAAKLAGWNQIAVKVVSDQEAALIREADAVRGASKLALPQLLDQLKAAYPTANVYGRVKGEDSIVEKCLGEGKTPGQLRDIIGTRVEFTSIADMKAAAAKFPTLMDADRMKDYLAQPSDQGYRSIHFNTAFQGAQSEVQFRTKNQTTWSDWMHDKLYKEHTEDPDKAAYIQRVKPMLMTYAKHMSDYFFKVDSGERADKPDCLTVVADTVGCL